ncbi:MAG: helix-turn-helix domain-containing protein [Rhodospirillales bacterium]
MSKPIEPLHLHIAARIKARRQAMGLSLDQTERALGFTPGVLGAIEAGTHPVSADQLATIGDVLVIGLGYFFEGSPMAPSEPGLNDPKAVLASWLAKAQKAP